VGTVGALACWEHYNPLARYALMAQHEQIHCSQFPGSLVGPIFSEQMEITMRHHALESGCFVVNATAWLTDEQKAAQAPTPDLLKAFSGGCYTAIISPEGKHLAEPLRDGEGMVVADLDFALITKRKRMMDSVGHYARPELLSLNLDQRPASPLAAIATAAPLQMGMPAPAPPPSTPSLGEQSNVELAYMNAIASLMGKS
jgi:aliphatic nitrilase